MVNKIAKSKFVQSLKRAVDEDACPDCSGILDHGWCHNCKQ